MQRPRPTPFQKILEGQSEKNFLSLPPDAFKMGGLTKAQKLGYISNGRGTLIIEAADGNADDHEQLTLEENAQNISG